MPQITFHVFGAPVIERDEIPIELDTRKALALMAYLVTTGKPQTRETLAALLWPDYDQPHARAALRRTLSSLNKALAGIWLSIRRDSILLSDDPDCQSDIQQFQVYLKGYQSHCATAHILCDTCMGQLQAIAALYRGDFLAGFTLRDSTNFDDWHFTESEYLRREISSALERLVHGYRERNQFTEAILIARRWLALDRLNENAHQQLMRLYTLSGKRTSALRQYQICVQFLQQELGVEPDEATTTLYEDIKTHQLHLASTDAQPLEEVAAPTSDERILSLPPKLSRDKFPLVGRSSEWTTLLTTYNAIEGDGHLIVLSGEAGIGKTRLAEEFITAVGAQGAHTITMRCYENETHIAFGPIADGLRSALADAAFVSRMETMPSIWRNEMARLLPEFTPKDATAVALLDDAAAQSRFLEGLRQIFITLCQSKNGAQPGLLFFDDMHWADSATLDALSYLVHRLLKFRLCIIVTWRNTEVAIPHRLRRLLGEAQRSNHATEITLSRLDNAAILELVNAINHQETLVSQQRVKQLFYETEGVPLFLVSYLTQHNHHNDENWIPTGSVRDLLHARLHALNPLSLNLLGAAATIGRSFDLDLLSLISKQNEDVIVTALEELMQYGIIKEMSVKPHAQSVTYDFSHEKLRTQVYEDLSLTRRHLLHRRVAEVLEARMTLSATDTRLLGNAAQQYLQSGNGLQAAFFFKRAGEIAFNLFANEEALTSLNTALQLGHPDQGAILKMIGDVQTRRSNYVAALSAYDQATQHASPELLPHLHRCIGHVYGRRGEWETAQYHLEQALATIEEDAPHRAWLYIDRSKIAFHQQHHRDAYLLAEHGLQVATSVADEHAIALAQNMLGLLARYEGNIDESCRYLRLSIDLATKLGDFSIRSASLNNLAQTAVLREDYVTAITLTQEALFLCIAQGDRHHAAALHNNLAETLHMMGQTIEAMEHLKAAVSIYADIGVESGEIQPDIWRLAAW